MRRPALSGARVVAPLAAALALAAAPAQAHLGLGERSLVRAFAAADAMGVARVVEATRDLPDGGAETRFTAVEWLAGARPAEVFVVDAGAPPLRFPDGEITLLLLASGSARGKRSTTQGGVRLSLPASGIGEHARAALLRLWAATHGAGAGGAAGRIDAGAAVAALTALTGAEEPRLGLVAAIELAELADDPEHFTAADRASIAARARDPEADATLRGVLAVVARRLDPPPRPHAAALAGPGAR